MYSLVIILTVHCGFKRLVEQSRKAAEKQKTFMQYPFLTHFGVKSRGKNKMNTIDKKIFDKHYQQLLQCLKLQGKADATIDAYSCALRRVTEHFNCMPEQLTPISPCMHYGYCGLNIVIRVYCFLTRREK